MRGVARDAVFENPRLRGGPRRRDNLRRAVADPLLRGDLERRC